MLREAKVLKNTYSTAVLNQLFESNLIVEEKEQIYRLNNHKIENNSICFTRDQQNALDKIDINSEDTYLIHGVTGSGKTEVYIELIKRVVSSGKKAIMLVPEISLTAQIVNKFYDHFGDDVAIFHSGLSVGEKYDEYLKILRDEVHIVVGTRSAIFTPLTKLGIIIIDEEHSETFKQDSNPRYHALDMAEFRKKYNHIPVILGSATPSLESMARALKGVYKYIPMPNRVGTSVLPSVEIVDMAEEMKKRNTIFSSTLKSKILDRLAKKEQTILLLNRRGYSTVISCKSCGYTYKCPYCDIALTYHKSSNNLRCHYCGYTVYKGDECPDCHEKALTDYGLGTEKLEIEIKKMFPSARVIRMDADTTRNKGAHEDIINKFKNHEYDILLGTQMISKGLNFPLVTLVGVINADGTLNIPDFRSGERTFALLSQVAGRAGRSELKGEVILQTFNPENFTLKCVQEQDYMKFYNYEMNNRHKLDYPPYYYLTSIKIASKDYDLASKEIIKVKNYLTKNLSNDTIILGPTTASMFKMNNVYRFQIILKYKKDPKLFSSLKELDEIYMLN
ncbi:MAG: primosomal protein N', partial [Bacilli bacterium]|nr:primosomal protein N' [Bacilli bacterium]